ncbi:hypothetical protein [Limnoglobus roseus]|uniref:Uncharacterized protein n=1 Tax=Limnoglobus roseus TaxID=2598579 RepID=A0A5C1A4S6_9BACT|nr:hypothetical protein [Limnoglobus roseus]QEL13315.1 hypothetical protein PX52LOC_00169 [Limnoglobus roseus]
MTMEPEALTPAVLGGQQVKVSSDTVRIGAPVAHVKHGEPTIQLVREDGVIRAIDITCGCGERIRIQCDYA